MRPLYITLSISSGSLYLASIVIQGYTIQTAHIQRDPAGGHRACRRPVGCRFQAPCYTGPRSDVAQDATPLRSSEHFRLLDPPNLGFLVLLAKRQSIAGQGSKIPSYLLCSALHFDVSLGQNHALIRSTALSFRYKYLPIILSFRYYL